MAYIWRCFRHAWEQKLRHVETRARAPRSLRSHSDALPMRAGATLGDNWVRAHIPLHHQQRCWLCAPARRRDGHGRRSSRWRSCSGPSDYRLRGVTLPLRTRGQVLKMALDALQLHLQAGDLLQGKEVWMAKSLLPLGAWPQPAQPAGAGSVAAS